VKEEEEMADIKKTLSERKKKIIKWGIVGVLAAAAVFLVVVYRDEINKMLSSPDKSAANKQGNVIVARAKVPTKKPAKKAKKKPAKKASKKGKKAVAPVPKDVPPKPAEPAADKPATPPADDPDTKPAEEKNRCAELPFSYEFKDDDPDAKHPLRKKFWGPNFGCLLAGAHDDDKPGPVSQVREELNAMSSAQFERYKARLERIMRKFACRTFDYYVSTCKEYLDPRVENYLSVDELSVLLRQRASLYDVSAVDRHRFRYHPRRPKKSNKAKAKKLPVFEPPTESGSGTTKPKKRRIKVGVNTRHLPPRLCGDLRRCPKP
jgi:hypothetical protein